MQVEVVMPKMGESIQEGKILRWMKKPGDKIEKDETILEISTDKVDSEIPSPSAGVLTKIVAPEGETVDVGTVIAMIETDVKAAKVDTSSPMPASKQEKRVESKSEEGGQPAEVAVEAHEAVPRGRDGSRFYSPLVRTIAQKEGIALEELDQISGSGVSGRVTKNDILDYLNKRGDRPTLVPGAKPESQLQKLDLKELQKKYPQPDYEVVQMDNVQLKMAEHMVRSVHTSPHVEAISECDVTRMVSFREQNADRFEKQEGFKLTYTHFIVDAAVRALKEFPLINSSLEGDKIIKKKFINFGLAVASPSGLIVPVIKHAEEKNFLGLARAINDLAVRTRNKQLKPDDVQGGTFTLTNYGVFGNIIGLPIISQPQLAILGVGAFKKRPVVVTDAEGNDSIAIRTMAYFTLSFDHRVVDGELGGKFLSQVVANIEQFDFSNVL